MVTKQIYINICTGHKDQGDQTDTGQAGHGDQTDIYTGQAGHGDQTDTGQAGHGDQTDTGQTGYGDQTDIYIQDRQVKVVRQTHYSRVEGFLKKTNWAHVML